MISREAQINYLEIISPEKLHLSDHEAVDILEAPGQAVAVAVTRASCSGERG